MKVGGNGAFGRPNRYESSDEWVAKGNAPGGTKGWGAVSSLNWYAKVGTCADVQRSTCKAGHAKFASETSVLKATIGSGYAASGYSTAIAAARAAGTPSTVAMTLW